MESKVLSVQSLSNEQRKFIDIVYIQCRKFDEACAEIGIDRATISNWNIELESIWRPITSVRNLWKRKKAGEDFWTFYEWVSTNEKKCNYCGITEDQIQTLITKGLKNKRSATRGKSLEIDRKVADKEYSEISNLTYSCYWCNNAKTDTFTEEEFKEIGKAIGEIWKKRLSL